MRARDLGIPFEGMPGPLNAITDLAGIKVGFQTVIEAHPRPGRKKLIRTGATAIIPHADAAAPVPVWAGFHRFNGNGEMTGTHWIEDSGQFTGPVMLTNTHAIGMAHHAVVRWMIDRHPGFWDGPDHGWVMPVVAETYDGVLNDIDALPLTEADMLAALNAARAGALAEGSVGGGTGMICYGFKGGTGTASRLVADAGQVFRLGVLVQANYGRKPALTIAGVPIGQVLAKDPAPAQPERGSVIAIIATDAPLAPHQLARLARRATLGIGRSGTIGGNSSGDLFLAFSTANPRPLPHGPEPFSLQMLPDDALDGFYAAAVQAVDEAVINAMVAAGPMGGTQWDEVLVPALPQQAVLALLRAHGRL